MEYASDYHYFIYISQSTHYLRYSVQQRDYTLIACAASFNHAALKSSLVFVSLETKKA